MENIACEKCSHIMVKYKTDTCEGMKCPNCGWGWVTTRDDLISLDETLYNIKIDCRIKPSNEQLKVLSSVLNVNYLAINKLLKEGNISFSGKAIEIKDKLVVLKNSGICFSIFPDFKYEI